MESNWRNYTKKMTQNPPAAAKVISELRSSVDFWIPDDYLGFLAEMNGYEGLVGESYLDLWHGEDLVAKNEQYKTEEYASGYFIFGSNLGGTAYAYEKGDGSIVEFELVSMLISDEPYFLGAKFGDFLNSLATK